jgi:hypothetical protein
MAAHLTHMVSSIPTLFQGNNANAYQRTLQQVIAELSRIIHGALVLHVRVRVQMRKLYIGCDMLKGNIKFLLRLIV